MKRYLFILVCCIPFLGHEQTNFHGKQKIFKVSVARTTSYTSTGYLADVEDSVISLTPSAGSILYNAVDKNDLVNIHYSDIKSVTIKRNGSVGRGILFGSLVGLGIGTIAGLVAGGDASCNADQLNLVCYGVCQASGYTAAEKALQLGGAGALTGAMVGGVIGALAKKRFIIGRKKEKFSEMQITVLERMYSSPQNK